MSSVEEYTTTVSRFPLTTNGIDHLDSFGNDIDLTGSENSFDTANIFLY